ncbi:MAG: hypothetical protein ABI480_18385 [Chitinophagaceae bacterium]
MAKEKQSLSGKIGPVVVYQLNGKNVVRSKPRRYKQTTGTKARSKNFGKASTLGAQLRSGLERVIPFPKDISMQTRLTGAISKWLGTTALKDVQPQKHIPWLSDFEFNEKAKLNSRWKELLKVGEPTTDGILLNIPAFIPVDVINGPAKTTSIECRIGAVSCNLLTQSGTKGFYTSFSFPNTDQKVATQEILMKVNTKPGNVVLVVSSLVYFGNKGGEKVEREEVRWRPVSIIIAFHC